MFDSPSLLIQVFLEMDEVALREMRDGRFETATAGTGILIKASVNGSSFEYHAPSAMSFSQIVSMSQMALNYKAARVRRPITRTTVRFA